MLPIMAARYLLEPEWKQVLKTLMKTFLIILSVSLVPIFSGCYTQFAVEKDETTFAETPETPDSVAYIYIPQNGLVPIHGWTPVPESPTEPATEEVTPEPQTELWQDFSYPILLPAYHSPNPVESAVGRVSFYSPVSTPQPMNAQTTSVSTLPETNVRRTSGVQRVTSRIPVSSSTDETTRNSGTTRRGRR